MTIENGGPAFPTASDNGQSANQDGMTLRDYFAAQIIGHVISRAGHGVTDDQAAASAYKLADALINARGAA